MAPWICQRCGEQLPEVLGTPIHHRMSAQQWTCTKPQLEPFLNLPYACSRQADEIEFHDVDALALFDDEVQA